MRPFLAVFVLWVLFHLIGALLDRRQLSFWRLGMGVWATWLLVVG